MVIMATFWVTEALPLAVTSLLPVALLPILGNFFRHPSFSTRQVAMKYLPVVEFAVS